jgi:tetratricopeptide (TPR) repeat protein
VRIALAILLALVTTEAGRAQHPQTIEATVRQAWDAVNAGRAAEAEALFEQALKAAPGEPALLAGAAAAAHLAGRPDVARMHLVNALAEDPKFTPASLLLGQLLYSLGDPAGAITIYEEAQRYAPYHPQLKQKLERWRQEAALHEGFNQRVGTHFTVLVEGPAEAPLAARAVDVLEKAYWKIGAALYAYPADVITVVLYTREQFRDVTQSPAWAGGAFDGRIRVPVQGALENAAEFERVLTHELTHAFVRSIAGQSAPNWLNEGLAIHFEGSDLSRHTARIQAATGRLPLGRLEESFGAFDATQARTAYAESGVAVARLFKEAGPTGVANLLGDLAAQMPFGAAFERNVGMTYEAFQQLMINPL